jgi:hypothetical protein
MKKLKITAVIFIFMLSAVFINVRTPDANRIVDTLPCSRKEYKTYKLQIADLGFNELFYNDGSTVIENQEYYDDNSIPLHNYKGKLNYHPVFLAEIGLDLIDVYNSTHDTEPLNSAISIAEKLMSTSLSVKSSIFFPYTFDFPLHGYQDDIMYAPWYSSMAQGQILSLFSRLYEITQNERYLEISQRIFNSFDLSHYYDDDPTTPWVSCVDTDGYLWLEEYPVTPPAHTLNGMMFTMFGIYDFHRVTKDPMAEHVQRGAIITIKENIQKFRVPNGISHYCLRHPQVFSLHYHNIHIMQLKMLYKMTGDKFFLDTANDFSKDTQELVSGG